MSLSSGDGSGSGIKTLTPAEVHNVAFKKPPIGKRGYDEEEVDNFLDVVEAELARLIEENESLRHRGDGGHDDAQLANITDQDLVEENRRLSEALSRAQQEQAAAVARAQQEQAAALSQARQEAAAALSQGSGDRDEAVRRLQEAHQSAEQRAQQAEQRVSQAEQRAQQAEEALNQAQEQLRSSASTGSPAAASADHHQQAVKVLALAQQTADQHLSEAQQEAEQLRAQAQATADQLERESTVAAEQLVREAHERAEGLTRDSEARAVKVRQDAEQHAAAVNEALETRKASLERRLEELSTFEREYRSRLKSYLESQLRDLEHGADDDGAAPAAAGAQRGSQG
ncbi:MAG: DivIVA domain-containing protein [Actinomycetota bacterium]|nr:DivIVA domain-containing protein [Actinomycetota bacterium]